jgi:hypothetical protein
VRQLVSRSVGGPHHHNAWGALVMHMVRTGRLVATGEYRPMKDVKSHARKTPVYRVLR